MKNSSIRCLVKSISSYKIIFYLLSTIALIFNTLDIQGQRNRYRQSNRNVSVSFIVKSATSLNSDKIYITGNLPGFGPWVPNKVALFKYPDGSWIATYKMPVGTPIELQYTRGSFEKVETDREGDELLHSFVLSRDTLIKHTIRSWKGSAGGNYNESPINSNPKVVKVKPVKPAFQFVRKHQDLSSDGVSRRKITVHLPKSYETDEQKNYPVVYVHLVPVSGSTDQLNERMFDTGVIAKQLMLNGESDEFITVMVHSSADYTLGRFSTSQYYPYRNFLLNVVKPLVDNKYRTKADAANTASLGIYSGALISFLLTWEHSEVFGKSACINPIFESTAKYFTYAKQVRESIETSTGSFYFDSGSTRPDLRFEPGIERMIMVLNEKGVYPEFYQGSEHSNADSRIRIKRALQHLFGW